MRNTMKTLRHQKKTLNSMIQSKTFKSFDMKERIFIGAYQIKYTPLFSYHPMRTTHDILKNTSSLHQK